MTVDKSKMTSKSNRKSENYFSRNEQIRSCSLAKKWPERKNSFRIVMTRNENDIKAHFTRPQTKRPNTPLQIPTYDTYIFRYFLVFYSLLRKYNHIRLGFCPRDSFYAIKIHYHENQRFSSDLFLCEKQTIKVTLALIQSR